MTKDETRKAIEVMQAYVDGAEVQFRRPGEKRWCKKNGGLGFAFDLFEYRVKPKPREWFLVWNDDGYSETKPWAVLLPQYDGCVGHWKNVVRVREVIDD